MSKCLPPMALQEHNVGRTEVHWYFSRQSKRKISSAISTTWQYLLPNFLISWFLLSPFFFWDGPGHSVDAAGVVGCAGQVAPHHRTHQVEGQDDEDANTCHRHLYTQHNNPTWLIARRRRKVMKMQIHITATFTCNTIITHDSLPDGGVGATKMQIHVIATFTHNRIIRSGIE